MRDDDAIANGPTDLASLEDTETDAPERLRTGSFAGDYRVERFIGAGAMGDVYAGVQPVIGKDVAIKVIKRRLASSEEAAERFIREARAVNQVDHPNVARRIQRTGDSTTVRLYLVMDLLEGKSLGEQPRGTTDRLPLPEMLSDPRARSAKRLQAAHANATSCIETSNRTTCSSPTAPAAERQRVYVLDFGIAKFLQRRSRQDRRRRARSPGEGSWIGTPAVHGARAVEPPRADYTADQTSTPSAS